jgi:disulfide bond formation protein DsbB
MFMIPVVAALALAVAYTAQLAFSIWPCELCLWERWPYWVLIALGLAAALKPSHARLWLCLMLVMALAEAGLAAFHLGVENHLWAGSGSCAPAAPKGEDIASLREALLATPSVRCDEVNWRILGLSAVLWNFALALGLSGLTAFGFLRARGDR